MYRLLFLLLVSISLISCEGNTYFKGRVYDADTRQPIKGVKVGKRYTQKDNWRVRLEYDTVSTSMREALRKRGLKDDYSYYSGFPFDDTLAKARGWSHKDRYLHYTESYTDENGNFGVGPSLVGLMLGAPKTELIFNKEGYEPLYWKTNKQVHDSVKVFMKRK